MKSLDQRKIENIADLLDRPIVLIGMMGAGKTKTGKMIAAALGLPFFDSDDEIEKAARMSIDEIFSRFGEEYFRSGEKRVISRLLDGKVKVIATGGGAVMTPGTADAIWKESIPVWVRADMDVMLERVGRTEKRPLLKNGDPSEILAALAEQRYPVYEKADIIIDSHTGPAEALLNQFLDKLHDCLTHASKENSRRS